MRLFLFLLFFAPAVASAAAPATPSVAPDPFNKLLGGLDDSEWDYHDSLFSYVMANVPDGKDYPWKSYRSHGSFRPGVLEKSENTVCRPFHEELASDSASATFDGIACRRSGREGWCRLKTSDLRSCALEPPRNLLEQVAHDTQTLEFQGSEQLRRAQDQGREKWQGWTDWLPDWR